MTMICDHCRAPIIDGEEYEFTQGRAWHTNGVYCIRNLRGRIEALEQRPLLWRALPSGRNVEHKDTTTDTTTR